MMVRPRRSGDLLGARALNRAPLERQLLRRRATLSAEKAIEHLVGLQAQVVRRRGRASLIIEPLGRVRQQDRASLTDEGRRLLSFATSASEMDDVRFARSG